jgi:hypothetical protein
MNYTKFFNTEATFNADMSNLGIPNDGDTKNTSYGQVSSTNVENTYSNVQASLPSSLKSKTVSNNVSITNLQNKVRLYANNLQKLGNRNKKLTELKLLNDLNNQTLKGTHDLQTGQQRELCQTYNKLTRTTDGSRVVILQHMKDSERKTQVVYALGDLVLLSLCWLISLYLYTRGMMTYKTYIMVFTGLMVLIILAMIYRHFFYQSMFDVRYYMDSVTTVFQKIVSYINLELTGGHLPSCPKNCKSKHVKDINGIKSKKQSVVQICSQY